MRRHLFLLVFLSAAAVLLGSRAVGLAHSGPGPVVDILGKPDSNPPDIDAYVSVVDPDTGRTVGGLDGDNFAVRVSDIEIPAGDVGVSLETTGLAVVIIVDRGGIARAGDARIGYAVDLAGSLLEQLDVNGTATTDMVALIGVRGRDSGGLTPLVPFTNFDPIAISNELVELRMETVPEVTPLYDGIDRAIEWITDNPISDVQQQLAHRRPVIVVFSDGVDKRFSDEARRLDIIAQCREHDVLLYTVRMGGGPTDPYNMQVMAEQTNGRYVTHSGSGDDQAADLFEDIVTQRRSYDVSFPLYRPQGDYEMEIQVLDTPLGDGSDEETVSSRLQLPAVSLATPEDGAAYTVPYSRTPRVLIPLSVVLMYPDGAVRQPSAVRYYRNGVLIGTETTPPFAMEWDPMDYVAQTAETRVETFTFSVEADDLYLAQATNRDEATVRVEWEPLPALPLTQRIQAWLAAYWWLIALLAAVGTGSGVSLAAMWAAGRERALPGPVANPYVAGNPVIGDLFAGREDVMRRLQELWSGVGQKPSVVLYGHRRMGKSSILNNLGGRFGPGTLIVDFDMQRVGLVAGTGELLHNLALALYDSLDPARQGQLGEPEEGRFVGHNPYTAFDRFLKRLDRLRSATRFIVTVDEFELIEELIAEGRLEPRLLDFWRGLITTYPWFVMAFAGLHELEEMRRDYWNPLFGTVTAVPVGFLSSGAARRLITHPAPGFALGYTADAAKRIVALTHGQPYLVQLICHGLVARHNRRVAEKGREQGRPSPFSQSDVAAVIDAPEFFRDGNAYFTGVWRQARASKPPGQAGVLVALSRAETGMAAEEIARRAGLLPEEGRQALEALSRHDVVEEEGGCYRFTVELMRRWVAQREGGKQ
jgi:Mg-chelatase subunit ChlD